MPMNTLDTTHWLGIEEFARKHSVHSGTVRRSIKDGSLWMRRVA